MSEGQNTRPIVIKRKKVSGGDGHHGGAWKVAYADFVTAMMAFFMLMWLLNATTEQQRKGIADYFSPTIPITRISGGGDGSFGGDSVFSETTAAQSGTGATSQRTTEGRQALGANGSDHRAEEEDSALREMEAAILAGIGGDAAQSDTMFRHVQTRLTDEGLVIEIFEREGAPLFRPEDGQAADWLTELIGILSELLMTVRNDVAISAHVAAEPLVRTGPGPWERSVTRAQAIRELLVASAFDPARLLRVTGYADRTPLTRDPMAERNNRIEITVLREN
jgi:chemotaxis protein MotB